MNNKIKGTACPPVGSQLLRNPAFEENFAFWNGANSILIRIPRLIHKGRAAALLGKNSTKTAFIRQRGIAVGRGCGLRLSVFLRKAQVQKNTIVLVRLSFRNSRGKLIGLPVEVRIPGPILPAVYVPFFTEVTTPAGTATATVTVAKLGSGSVLVDNVALISVPPIA
ncbi:MAG: hypothetical protein M0Z31_08100 [Clostridia bacterium]|nr:hypothetical protein [Clostridia bacterium]